MVRGVKVDCEAVWIGHSRDHQLQSRARRARRTLPFPQKDAGGNSRMIKTLMMPPHTFFPAFNLQEQCTAQDAIRLQQETQAFILTEYNYSGAQFDRPSIRREQNCWVE